MVNQGIIVAPAIIIVVFLIVVFSLPEEKSNGTELITIVANLPITGPASGIGIENRDGLQMAVDELNMSGGINGNQIELVIVDNETDLEKAKKIFLETEQTHEPLIHISALSFISTGLGQLAEENDVLLIALSAVAPEVTQDKEWVFRYFAMAEEESIPILQTLKKLNVDNLGILYLDDEFGRSIANTVATKFDNSVTLEPFAPNTKNFKENIAKLENKDAIFVVAFPDYIEIILKQLHETDYQGEILTSSDGATFKIFSMPESEGVYLGAPIIYNSDFQLASQIGILYETEYGKELDHNAANGYDIIRILNGLLNEKETSRELLKDELNAGFTYSGIFGTIQVTPKNHDIQFQLFPAKIINGEIQFER
jgi:branched-chain amino acid transport system substrate-binding protein